MGLKRGDAIYEYTDWPSVFTQIGEMHMNYLEAQSTKWFLFYILNTGIYPYMVNLAGSAPSTMKMCLYLSNEE